MQTLRIKTSQSSLLAPTLSIYQACLHFRSAFKYTLNHDITRYLSSRSGKIQDEDELKNQINGSSEKPFQTTENSTGQKLFDKNINQTNKLNNHSQTKQDISGWVENITRLIFQNRSPSVNNSESENQEPAAIRESLLFGSQKPSDLSGSSMVKLKKPSKNRTSRKSESSRRSEKIPVGPNVPLIKELFPGEFGDAAASDTVDEVEEVVPRLPLAEFDHEDELYNGVQNRRHFGDTRMRRPNSEDVLHEWDLAVLVLSRASKSLVESDFRRLIPRGKHIENWCGPGDILKVIPARDYSTLRQAGHYFLLFPNSAYAQAYQKHVYSLHKIVRAHTRTSIESPMSPPPGVLVDGEDVYSILKNYTLHSPFQKVWLRDVELPYPSGLKQLLELRGYPQIIKAEDKSCKLVLFWVDGFQPTIRDIKDWISSDEENRGLPWALADSIKPAIEKVDSAAAREGEEADLGAITEPADTPRFRGLYPRYLIRFVDENEARRFIRAWHRRPFPLPKDAISSSEVPRLVHAEFIW